MSMIKKYSNDQRGAALLVAIIVIVMVTGLAATFMRMAYNMKLVMYGVSGGRTYAHYRAQAGIVDAQFRLRTNYLNGLASPAPPANGFRDPTYAVSYYITIGMGYGGAQINYTPGATRIDISAAAGGTVNGVRTITAIGREYDK